MVIFVDDATSRITAGKFTEAETTVAYQDILEEHLTKYGRPLGLYVDKHSIFRTSRENSCHKERETHFGRILRELDIELICAHSPQAKGRVERANGTLQDRLIKEMRLKKINTIEEANRFLPEFIEEYNERFGKEPRNKEDAHRAMIYRNNLKNWFLAASGLPQNFPSHLRLAIRQWSLAPKRNSEDLPCQSPDSSSCFGIQEDKLERIFARRSIRKLSKSLSFRYNGKEYQLQPKNLNRFRKTYVNVIDRPGKPVLIESDGEEITYTEWDHHGQPKVLNSKELEAYWPKTSRKPGKHHPWR